MKKSITISDNDKWQAVVNCDGNYDGMLFYGVKTTGIFCRPSCKSKTPMRGNVIFFDNAAKAIETGFRPCKRCCPDKAAETLKQTDISILEIAHRTGFESLSNFYKCFKEQTGHTPHEYRKSRGDM